MTVWNQRRRYLFCRENFHAGKTKPQDVMLLWDMRTDERLDPTIWVVTESCFFCFRLLHFSTSCFPISSSFFAPLIFATLTFCYATVRTGCAQGCLGAAINGTGGRSEAREERSRNEEASFCSASTSLGGGIVDQALYWCPTMSCIIVRFNQNVSQVCLFYLNIESSIKTLINQPLKANLRPSFVFSALTWQMLLTLYILKTKIHNSFWTFFSFQTIWASYVNNCALIKYHFIYLSGSCYANVTNEKAALLPLFKGVYCSCFITVIYKCI